MESWLALKISGAEEGKVSTVFFIVPKKIVRLAVERNRIKRVLREAIRAEGLFKPGMNYALRVLKKPQKLNLAIARESLRSLC